MNNGYVATAGIHDVWPHDLMHETVEQRPYENSSNGSMTAWLEFDG